MIFDLLPMITITFVLWERNHRTLEFFLSMNKRISSFKDGTYNKRLEILNSINYLSVCFQIWRPLHPGEWYSDISFLEEDFKCE